MTDNTPDRTASRASSRPSSPTCTSTCTTSSYAAASCGSPSTRRPAATPASTSSRSPWPPACSAASSTTTTRCPGHYTLEVSSPGLERSLRTPAHFQRSVGKPIAVRLREVANGERRVHGRRSTAADDDDDHRARSTTASSARHPHVADRPGQDGVRWGPRRPKPGQGATPSRPSEGKSDELTRHVRSGPHAGDREEHLGRHAAARAGRRPGHRLQAPPGAADEVVVEVNPDTMEFTFIAYDVDEDGNWVNERDDTPKKEELGRIAAQTFRQVMSQRIREAERDRKFEEYANREGDIVTGIIQQTDQRYTLLDLGRGREPAAAGRAGAVRAPAAGRPPQGVHRRGPQDRQGPADRRQPHPPGPDQAPVRARGARDRRRHRRDQGLRPRARPPHEDRRVEQRPQRRPGRRLRRRPWRPRAHGRQRAARREDRHRPVQRGPRRLRRQGAVAGQGQGGHHLATTSPRPTSSCPTTSSAWPSARRARTPASPPASPACASTSAARPSRSTSIRRRRATTPRASGSPNAETGEMEWHAADGSVVTPGRVERAGRRRAPTSRRPTAAPRRRRGRRGVGRRPTVADGEADATPPTSVAEPATPTPTRVRTTPTRRSARVAPASAAARDAAAVGSWCAARSAPTAPRRRPHARRAGAHGCARSRAASIRRCDGAASTGRGERPVGRRRLRRRCGSRSKPLSTEHERIVGRRAVPARRTDD